MVVHVNEALASENVWVEKSRYANAERQFYEMLYKNERSVQKEDGKTSVSKILKKNTSANDSFVKSNIKFGALNCEDGKYNAINTKPKKLKSVCNNRREVQNDQILRISAKKNKGNSFNNQCTLVSEIAKAREHIKNSLEKMDGIANLAATPVSSEILDRLNAVEKNNNDLHKLVESLKSICIDNQKRILELETQLITQKNEGSSKNINKQSEDDGVDLFASDSEDENAEAVRIREERLAAYAAKKSKKPVLIAKSSLVLDVKPWDDETDLKKMEEEIRKITLEGLLWGASKFVPVAFGIQKLSISCVVEDEKVSIDWLTEEIEKLEEYVQSVDVAAFNKI